MTLLVGGIGVVLAVSSALFLGSLGRAAALDTRAQAAADAVALAAAAESGPYGSGTPERVAELYANLNGASIVECRCTAGATAVQVTVNLDGALARARAVIDPELFAPSIASAGRLDPRLAAAVNELIAAADGRLQVASGARSTAEQTRLWQEALARYGSAEAADDWVAPPGHSMHERGLAVDLSGDLSLAEQLIDRLSLPLWRPLAHEPWHFEVIGSRG